MPKTVTIDWNSFMDGNITTQRNADTKRAIVQGFAIAASIAAITDVLDPHEEAIAALAHGNIDSVAVVAHPSGSIEQSLMPLAAHTQSQGDMEFSDDASWADTIIPMLKHQALPLTVTMVCWAGLEMILRRPSSALDRAKWAILGYLGMQFALPFVKHLGHRYGDV